MKSQFEVRQATLDDVDDLKKFYKVAYAGKDQYKYPERWQWLYRNNPFIPDGMVPPVWIASKDDQIIGHTGAMYVPLWIGNQVHLSAWSVDSVVLPEVRGIGVGKSLQRANQGAHDIFMSLEMSAINRAIKKKIGGVEGPKVALYYYTNSISPKFLFAGPKEKMKKHLGKTIGSMVYMLGYVTGLTHLTAATAGICLRRRQRCQGLPPLVNLKFEQITGRFGAEADELWNRIKGRYDFAVERSSTYLNWKFVDQPFMKYQRYYVRKINQLEGILIFRKAKTPEPPIGIINEVISTESSPERLQTMLDFAHSKLIQQGAIGIYCASASPETHIALNRQGYLEIRNDPMMIFFRETPDISLDQCLVLLVKGDHDWDQFPRVQQISYSQIRKALKIG